MPTILITDATIVAGVHAEAGTVHDVPAAEAMLIISAGRAVRHTCVPVAPNPEAAQVAPAVETASLDKSAKPARRRASTPAA